MIPWNPISLKYKYCFNLLIKKQTLPFRKLIKMYVSIYLYSSRRRSVPIWTEALGVWSGGRIHIEIERERGRERGRMRKRGGERLWEKGGETIRLEKLMVGISYCTYRQRIWHCANLSVVNKYIKTDRHNLNSLKRIS